MKPFIILLISALVYLSCEQEDSKNSESLASRTSLVGLEETQFDSIWEDMLSDNPTSDPFELLSVSLLDTVLLIDVSYGGGCEYHNFQLIWPDGIIAIFPPSFAVILVHDSPDLHCEALITETLSFDLTDNPLGIDINTFSIMDLTIMNGSNPDQSLKLNEF